MIKIQFKCKCNIEEYFSTIPIEKIPRLGAPGEKYRDHQLIKQLPAYDLALAYSKFVETENRPKFHEFVEKRNIFNLDIGYVRPANENNKVCKNCGKDIRSREIIVIAPKLGEDNCWHPPCFVCTVCKELLVDLAYCVKNGCLYCERHFADTVRPRCSGCDENTFLIKSQFKKLKARYLKKLKFNMNNMLCCKNVDFISRIVKDYNSKRTLILLFENCLANSTSLAFVKIIHRRRHLL
uniref:LIM zinc-binding domain-containing protein n=1 Tax=Tetranychus urticae TaxID=32264 RepID=T1L5C0_TETUR